MTTTKVKTATPTPGTRVATKIFEKLSSFISLFSLSLSLSLRERERADTIITHMEFSKFFGERGENTLFQKCSKNGLVSKKIENIIINFPGGSDSKVIKITFF